MGFVIEYDSPEQKERVETIRAGGVYADLNEAKNLIDVSWSGQRNKDDVLGLKLKSIGGLGMAGGGGHVPLTLTNCRSLRKLYGATLEISERLNDWAYDEIDRLGNIENLSSASSDAQLSEGFYNEAPLIGRIMHAYQRAGTAFCASAKRALLADQPGLGKTLQTIATMVEAGVEGDILVAAPSAAVAITWPDELRKWLPGEEVVVVMGQGTRRHQILKDAFDQPRRGKRRWFIVNLEMIRSKWIKPNKELRYPKVGPNSRRGEFPTKRWFPIPGWFDHSYPELFGSFEVTEKILVKEWKDLNLDTGEMDVIKEYEDQTRTIEREPWAAIVVDESHRALICATAEPQGQNLVRAGMGMLPLKEDGIKLALSGTPMRGKPENLWGTLNWLYPETYSSYWNWVKRWFVIWGDKSDKEIEGLDEQKTGEFYQDIKTIMLRRTKKEVRAELPDKLYAGTPLADESGFVDENSPVGHWLEMSPKQKKAYDEIQHQAETALESGILVANGVLAELTRLKQFASTFGDLEHYLDAEGEDCYRFIPQMPSVKFDWLVEFLDELGINKNSTMEIEEDGEEEVRKVVVASQFTSILDLYERELNKKGIQTLKITGKVTQAQRKINKDRWQEPGGPRVFLLNIQAGGVSLTLDAADDLVFLDETWIPDDQEQVEDRIHRVSRMHQVTIHYLRSLGTIEEAIALTTGSRERITKRLIDGERGVSFAKKLLTPIKRS